MLHFDCDYMRGGHPEVMDALTATNMLQTPGYGNDEFTAQARKTILEACGLESGDVFFIAGGTMTNRVVIDRLLDRNDGVLCGDTAHINCHEAGAIEADGHKVITLPAVEGKITAQQIADYCEDFLADDSRDHIVRPAMVYISHPTELGTLYTLTELTALSQTCRSLDLPLYIDGARLAYGLNAPGTDVTLRDIAALSDAFYIGGTKCGALFGEAIVTSRPELFRRFMSLCKLHGAVMAKGRIIPIQFQRLIEDGCRLYNDIGRHAIEMAMALREGMAAAGYPPVIDSPTNQQFFRLPNDVIDRLMTVASFEYWGPRGKEESMVRFVTDWATPSDAIATLLSRL